jgi:hypothetical protein
MPVLLKSGIWIFVLSVVGFVLSASGMCGPDTDFGTYVAEAAMFGAPLGVGMCVVAGVRAMFKRRIG